MITGWTHQPRIPALIHSKRWARLRLACRADGGLMSEGDHLSSALNIQPVQNSGAAARNAISMRSAGTSKPYDFAIGGTKINPHATNLISVDSLTTPSPLRVLRRCARVPSPGDW